MHSPEKPKLATGREIAREIALVYASPGLEAHAPCVIDEPYHTTGFSPTPSPPQSAAHGASLAADVLGVPMRSECTPLYSGK